MIKRVTLPLILPLIGNFTGPTPNASGKMAAFHTHSMFLSMTLELSKTKKKFLKTETSGHGH